MFFRSKKKECRIQLTRLDENNRKREHWAFAFPPHSAVAIGRISGCHIILDESTVSNSHCLIHLHENKLRITDLGSKYGTIVNSQKAGSMYILPKKGTLELGQAKLQFITIMPEAE